MSVLRDHFRATSDPFFVGHSTGEYLTLGYAMTRGLVFPWSGGGVVLRRRRLYPDVQAWTFCGFARPADSTIYNMLGFDHGANTAWQYASAIALGNGFVGDFCEPVRVDFDNTGAVIAPALPLFPFGISAAPIAGGKFLIAFEYDPYGQGAGPTDFQVFGGTNPAGVDYNTPLVDSVTGLAVVKYVAAGRRYVFTTAAFANGTEKVFAVRARNSSAVAEKNTRTSTTQFARTVTASAASVVVLGMRRV